MTRALVFDGDIPTVRDALPDDLPQFDLIGWRAYAKCSPMQGKLALGQANWAKIEAYRATATWAEQVVIDSAQEWRRDSQDIQFFGYMLEFDDAQMDALFEAAMQIAV